MYSQDIQQKTKFNNKDKTFKKEYETELIPKIYKKVIFHNC